MDATARRRWKQQGRPRQLAIGRGVFNHPRNGGSRGYSVDYRQRELTLFAQGVQPAVSQSSIRRWNMRLEPFAMTGNKSMSKMSALDMYSSLSLSLSLSLSFFLSFMVTMMTMMTMTATVAAGQSFVHSWKDDFFVFYYFHDIQPWSYQGHLYVFLYKALES